MAADDTPDIKPGDQVLFGHRAARVVKVEGDSIEVEFTDSATGATVRQWASTTLAELLHTAMVDDQPVIVEPPLDDDDTVEIPVALQRVIERRVRRVKTLVHNISLPQQVAASDCELAQHLSAGWETASVDVVWCGAEIQRVATLTREEVIPVPTTGAPAQPRRHQRVFVDPLANLPLARSIREHGVEATIEALNADAYRRGLDAAQYRLGQTRRIFTRRPGLPGRSDA
jgi:hypothetical protein